MMTSKYINRAQPTALASAVAFIAFTNISVDLFEMPSLELAKGGSYTARNSMLGSGYLSDAERLNVLTSFAKNLLENSMNLEPDVAQILNDNFWEIYDRF